MIKFGLGESVIEYFDFAKHHKRLAIHIARKYEDGEVKDLIKDDKFRKDVESNPDAVFIKSNRIYRGDKLEFAEDTYVWLNNLEYIDDEVNYYSVRSSNTRQTTHVRLKFQFEYGRAYIDYKYDTSGSHAMPFDSLCGHGFIESIINEIIDDGYGLKDSGIAVSDDADVTIIIVDENGQAVDCEMEMYEVEQSFIGIEVYKFEQEIITNEKELEEAQ